MSSVDEEKTVTVSINNEELARVNVSTAFTNTQIENLILKPGVNVVALDTDQFSLVKFGLGEILIKGRRQQ